MTDKTQTKAVSKAPLTDEEFVNKYNGGRKIIDFVGHKKIFFGISLGIIIIGIICNFIFGTQLDIQFSGGATLKYSNSGESISLNLLILCRWKDQRTESLHHMLRILWVTAAQR